MERRNASTLLDGVLEAGRADEIALVTEEGMVSYGELGRMVAAVGSYLNGLGVQREQRVLMVLDDSAAFHATFLGAMRIGAVPVPVNPMDRVDNHVYYLEDSYAKVLVIEAPLLPSLEAMLAARPDVQVVVVGGEVGRHTQFDYIVADGDDLRAPADTHQDDMAFWLYSSGSTGRPKGVVHSHRNIGVTADTYARNVLRIGPDDLCYSTTKLFHAYGLGNSLSFPMSVGAAAVLVRGRSAPGRIFEMVERRSRRCSSRCPRCTRRWSARRGRERPISRASGRACRPPSRCPRRCSVAWRDTTGVPILDGIGSTEMLHIYCSNSLDDLNPGTSGRPVPGYSLRIVDERGVDVAPGQAGDMMVRGDSCASFYWHQREKTRRCMRGRVVLHRRPVRRERGRLLRLPGPSRRHDQGRRVCGSRPQTSRHASFVIPPFPKPP